MSIDDEILSRLRAAKAWDKDATMDDFQIRAAENGYVLINLKTKRAQLIYDEFSKLSDLKQLFPNVHFVESGRETANAEDKSESAVADGLSKAGQTDRDNQTRTHRNPDDQTKGRTKS